MERIAAAHGTEWEVGDSQGGHVLVMRECELQGTID
jgi:hypothetical protein